MLDTHAAIRHFSSAASHYAAHAELQRLVRSRAMPLAAGCWHAGSQILDLGCGTGEFAQEAKGSGHRWRVFGLDCAFGMCRESAMRRLPTMQADAHSLPVADASMDGVFSSLMLQWCKRPERVFSEIARVLKPKSAALLTLPLAGTLHELAGAFKAVDDAPHVSEFITPHTLMGYIEQTPLSCQQFVQETITEYYPDSIALMRSLQAIGATNAHHARRRGLMTPRQFARIEQAYGQKRTERGLPASWQIVFLALRKEC